MANLSNSEKKKLNQIMNDPVAWAQVFLRTFDVKTGKIVPWTARWYQCEMLRDKSKKRVYRCGRRTGKCLPEWDEVIDYKTGERITVGELYKRGKANLVTLNEDYTLGPNFTNQIFDNGIKEVFRVTTKTGRQIDATGNHPLFTAEGWVDIDKLKIGQKVGLPSKLNYWNGKYISNNDAKILAYMIGDGNCTNKTIRFSANDDYPKIKKEMQNLCKHYQCELKQYEYNKKCDYNIVKKENVKTNKIKDLLKKYKVYGKNAKEKRIPNEILSCSKKAAQVFVSRLYATDGWVSFGYNKNDKFYSEIGYITSSKLLAQDLQHLLLKLGYNSYLKEKKVKYKNKTNISYTITIYKREDLISFIRTIDIFGKEEKTHKLLKILLSLPSTDKFIPKEVMKFVDEDRKEQGLFKKDLCLNPNDRLRMNLDIQANKLEHYAKVLRNDDLLNLARSEVIWDEITSIESIGEHRTYDVSIPQTFNFVVNDFITHNTETMVVDSLYNVCTKPNFRVLIVTPYETQVRLAFMRLGELIQESPLIKDMVVSNTKNPYMIKLKNNSAILGFTTGASSGGGAASVKKYI